MISKRNYFTILILMLMVFVMFMFVGVSSDIMSDVSTNRSTHDKVAINLGDTITADSLNLDEGVDSSHKKGRGVFSRNQKLQVAVISGGTDDAVSKTLIEWCVYNKYLYKVFSSLPDPGEMADYDAALLGNFKMTSSDLDRLYSYANQGKTMIFTRLPDYNEITENMSMAAFFGIQKGVARRITANGIKIFTGFMINKERIYKENDYYGEKDDTEISMPYYSLAPGYEVYAVGLLDDQYNLQIKDKDLPPLLWRATTKNSFVYVVNTDIFDGMSMLGVLTGFFSRQGEYFIYPIVNAQTISLIDYPYFSNENDEMSKQLYSRTSEAVARDLLWPNIIQIFKVYGGSYSFFAASQLDYSDKVGPNDDGINFYLREIDKLPGDMGLSLGQVSKADLEDIIAQNNAFFKKYLPDYYFTALYSAGFSSEEVERCLGINLLKDVRLVMSDYIKDCNMIDFLDDNVISVRFNQDSYQHETKDDLRMICIANALGMCNMKVDIGRVIYPESRSDEWNYLSLKWSRGITYYKDFSMLDMVSINEMEKRVRRFLALDYTYKYNLNQVDIVIDHFDQEAFFILCTNDRNIDHVVNGTSEKISSGIYLIKAMDANVHVRMVEVNVLGKPQNYKLIPCTPEKTSKED